MDAVDSSSCPVSNWFVIAHLWKISPERCPFGFLFLWAPQAHGSCAAPLLHFLVPDRMCHAAFPPAHTPAVLSQMQQEGQSGADKISEAFLALDMESVNYVLLSGSDARLKQPRWEIGTSPSREEELWRRCHEGTEKGAGMQGQPTASTSQLLG